MLKQTVSEKYTSTLEARDMFSLRATLISGQCFRWTEEDDGSITGVMKDMYLDLKQVGSTLYVSGCPEDRLSELFDYLDFGTDYDEICRECLSTEPRLNTAAERCAGIHILRQEPWEALCSFIISQNNNIQRIRLIIRRLCALCGDRILSVNTADDEQRFTFPDARAVASLTGEQLDRIGCGYRSGYILSAAESVASGQINFDKLREMDIEACREELLKLYGVGPKVADCFMLYGLHRLECFPRDVWIKRALAGEFRDTPLQNSRYAGVAQQYIFEYIRTQTSPA